MPGFTHKNRDKVFDHITMQKKNLRLIVAHNFNGNIEEASKFVEVDGKKFEADDKGQPKKNDKGEPIPFVEPTDGKPPKVEAENADLEALAKVNPAVAKILADKKAAEDALAAYNTDKEKSEREAAEKRGEWQTLAQTETQKREAAEKALKDREDLLTKYKEDTDFWLKTVMATIPKEKQSLIPSEFSSRQKLRYIMENAAQLGATVPGQKAAPIDKNDAQPVTTELQKTRNELNDLVKKGSARTREEEARMSQLAATVKKLAAEKEDK